MAMSDDQSQYEYYADPDNRVAAGPARRRASKPLTTHVPIRFSPEVIAEVKKLADKDGKAVSSWVRDVVEAEVKRRQPRPPETIGFAEAPSSIGLTSPAGVAILAVSGACTISDTEISRIFGGPAPNHPLGIAEVTPR